MTKKLGLLAVLLATFAFAGSAALYLAVAAPPEAPPAEAKDAARGWAQLRGDLPVDPSVKLGALPNGMRYVLQTSRVQPGRAALRLVITAGSMQEAKDQEGLAHFLEHMAFRGSKHVADGEVQKSLERIGLRMGADTNASTGGDRTIFKFNLAKNDDESLDTGLMLLREIASELTLDPATMDKERGVVLAEVALRDDPMRAMQKAQFARQLGDHPYARSPGGRPEVIKTAPVQRLRDFYDAYYRPERAIIVVVGDIDARAIEMKIAGRFGDWVGRGEPGKDPPPVMTQPAGDEVDVEVIAGMPQSQLQLQWFDPYSDRPLTQAERRKQLVEQLGVATIANRSGPLLEAAGNPAQGFRLNDVRINGVWNGRNLTATAVTDPAKAIDVMVTAWRQAAEQGLDEPELDRTIISLRSQRARARDTGPTASPQVLADQVASVAAVNGAFVSAKDAYDLFLDQVSTISLEEVNNALKDQVRGDSVLTWRGPVAPAGGAGALKAAYLSAKSKSLATFVAAAEKPWPYQEFGPKGQVAERRGISDLRVTFVRFKNGVRLSIKPTTYRKKDVVVRVSFGRGRLQMPRERLDASDFGISLWEKGGLGKLSYPEQRRILQREGISASASSTDDAFGFGTCGGGCLTPDKLDRFMQLAAAMFSDPAYRTDQWSNLMQQADSGDRTIPLTARATAGWHVPVLTHSGDVRWSFNTAELRKTWKPEDAVAWIKPIVASSPIEVVVAGDVNVDRVIDSVAKTLGALPERKETPEPKGLRNVAFPKPATVTLTHKGPAEQGLVYVCWPTTDMFTDIREHRRRLVLVQLMQARAVAQLRGADGKGYSPGALAASDQVLPGYGYITMASDFPPAELDRAIAEFETIAKDLSTNVVSADEFTRVMKPQIESTKSQREQNFYWVSSLAGAQLDPRKLDYIRSAEADYASMTPADILATAKRWLKPETEWKLKVLPEAIRAQ